MRKAGIIIAVIAVLFSGAAYAYHVARKIRCTAVIEFDGTDFIVIDHKCER
jgi:hypothetical protein